MESNSKNKKPSYMTFGKRHILVLWLFTGFVNVYVLRASINTAIVSMVNHTRTDAEQRSSLIALPNDTCPFPEISNTSEPAREGEFNWNSKTQGIVLGSFYYGYICTQFIGGSLLSRVLGVRLLYAIAVGGTGILNLLNPIAARTNIGLLIALRVMAGILQGVTFPCGSAILGNWIPKQERSVLVMLPFTGGNVGTILAAPLAGFLCDYGFDGGWPSVFYTTGTIGILWSMAWFYFVRDTPAEDPTISPEERKYIEENCQSAVKPVPLKQLPWKAIILSPPVWGLAIGQTCYLWFYNTLLISMSTYLKDVLHISATLTGIFTALAFISLTVLQLVAAFLSGFLIISKGVKTKLVRKSIYCFGAISSAAFLVTLKYAGCNTILVVIMLCSAAGLCGFGIAGYMVNCNDIGPQYAGILMGIVNSLGGISGFVSPAVTGFIISYESNIDTWQIVFYISAAICLVGALFFVLFADGEVQSWAEVKTSRQGEDKVEETTLKLIDPHPSSSSEQQA